MGDRLYGHVPGIEVGAVFADREALSKARVHGPPVGGIWGGKDGSESIVLNEGYVDDQDLGGEIIYTGHGGNDPNTRRQVRDQKWAVGNRGLGVSSDRGYPVRVTRGSKLKSPYAPDSGLRYDGLYRVASYWSELGQDNFKIWRYRLIAIPGESSFPVSEIPPKDTPNRVKTSILRIVRDTELAKSVKAKHDDRCQLCDLRIELPGSGYSEAAHIKPLGRPHDGPDLEDNILCLCPNHHVMFDRGAIWLDSKMTWQPIGQPLLRAEISPVASEYAAYHRAHFGLSNPF